MGRSHQLSLPVALGMLLELRGMTVKKARRPSIRSANLSHPSSSSLCWSFGDWKSEFQQSMAWFKILSGNHDLIPKPSSPTPRVFKDSIWTAEHVSFLVSLQHNPKGSPLLGLARLFILSSYNLEKRVPSCSCIGPGSMTVSR